MLSPRDYYLVTCDSVSPLPALSYERDPPTEIHNTTRFQSWDCVALNSVHARGTDLPLASPGRWILIEFGIRFGSFLASLCMSNRFLTGVGVLNAENSSTSVLFGPSFFSSEIVLVRSS